MLRHMQDEAGAMLSFLLSATMVMEVLLKKKLKINELTENASSKCLINS